MYLTPDGAVADAAIGSLPTLPMPVNYPQFNSMVLLPLEPPLYQTQVSTTTCLVLLLDPRS